MKNIRDACSALTLALLLLLSEGNHALAFGTYNVTGAGSTALNGCYSAIGDSSLYGGTNGYEAYGLNGSNHDYAFIYAATYTQFVGIPGGHWDGSDYYYNSNSGTYDPVGINHLDSTGTLPIPTVTYSDNPTCGGGTSTTTATATSTVYQIDYPQADIFMGFMIFYVVIFLLIKIFK